MALIIQCVNTKIFIKTRLILQITWERMKTFTILESASRLMLWIFIYSCFIFYSPIIFLSILIKQVLLSLYYGVLLLFLL